jgi:hypothetical protein
MRLLFSYVKGIIVPSGKYRVTVTHPGHPNRLSKAFRNGPMENFQQPFTAMLPKANQKDFRDALQIAQTN